MPYRLLLLFLFLFIFVQLVTAIRYTLGPVHVICVT